jgi:hypothetical protein
VIAQCSTCGQTFPVEQTGAQHCPHCGTHVYIEAPESPGSPPPPPVGEAGPGEGTGGYGAGGPGGYGTGGPGGYGAGGPGGPGMPPPPGAPFPGGPPAEGDPNPWDRKSELGFFGAFVQTVKETLLNPARFFGAMRVDNTEGAFSFGFICLLIGGWASMFWQWIQLRIQGGMMLPPDADFAEFAEIMRWMEMAFGGLGFVLLPIWGAIYLFLWAGLLHLAVMLLGANNHGWNATFRAVCYAQAPQLFGIVPFCGGLVAAIWSLVLYILAITWLHRTTPGRAVGAVFFWIVVCCCLFCGIFMLAAGVGGFAAAGGL